MPGKSSREDRNEGAMDRAKGRMKEAGGALTGDKDKKSEGRADQGKAKAREDLVTTLSASPSSLASQATSAVRRSVAVREWVPVVCGSPNDLLGCMK